MGVLAVCSGGSIGIFNPAGHYDENRYGIHYSDDPDRQSFRSGASPAGKRQVRASDRRPAPTRLHDARQTVP